jgi:hypothetical protein
MAIFSALPVQFILVLTSELRSSGCPAEGDKEKGREILIGAILAVSLQSINIV